MQLPKHAAGVAPVFQLRASSQMCLSALERLPCCAKHVDVTKAVAARWNARAAYACLVGAVSTGAHDDTQHTCMRGQPSSPGSGDRISWYEMSLNSLSGSRESQYLCSCAPHRSLQECLPRSQPAQ